MGFLFAVIQNLLSALKWSIPYARMILNVPYYSRRGVGILSDLKTI